jgi:YVTN family beta-propeller protein
MYFRLLVTIISLLMYAGLASAAPFAYIANSGGNSVTVIDAGAATPGVITTISLPDQSYPYAVAVSPNGVHAYVTCQDSNKIAVIDTVTNTVVKWLNLTLKPGGLAVNAAETRLYLADNNSNTLTVIDISKLFDTGVAGEVTRVQLSSTAVSAPDGVVINPANNTVYVANTNTGRIAIVSVNDVTDSYAKSGEIALDAGDYPMGLALSPTGDKLYVANFLTGSVAVINTGTKAISARLTVGTATATVAVNPQSTTKLAYAPSGSTDKVNFIDTSAATDVVLTTPQPGNPDVGPGPWGAAVTPDGTKLFIVNNLGGTVSVLNAVTGAPINSIPVGVKPTSMGNFMSPEYQFVVNASVDPAGTGTGTIFPAAGAIPVTAIGRTFCFTPNGTDVIDTVTLNGTDKGAQHCIDIANISANQNLVVKFAAAGGVNRQPLTVELTNIGGRVYTTPAGIDITSGIATADFTTGGLVTITADFTQYPGRSIEFWGGACAGVSQFVNSCTVTMDAAKAVQIKFQNKPPQDKVFIVETSSYIGNIGAAIQAAANGQTLKVVKNYDTLYQVDNIVANYSTANVTLSGGWEDMGFVTRNPNIYTRLGSLTIQSNGIIADMIVIQ